MSVRILQADALDVDPLRGRWKARWIVANKLLTQIKLTGMEKREQRLQRAQSARLRLRPARRGRTEDDYHLM